ncbi:MAG: hypothetical protein HKN81_01555, partial [Gammaproteobacteria bacterium]|nr:hypothetical protein [Gammaproteobacteria bacterium]
NESFHELIASRDRKYDRESWSKLKEHWRAVLEGLAAEFTAGDCRIDLQQDRMAVGQFAMLTRRWELPSLPTGGDEE